MGTRPKKWTNAQLVEAARTSKSVRQVLKKIGLVPAGGNYVQVQKYLRELKIDIEHFTGMGWKKGDDRPTIPPKPLELILVNHSDYQSNRLKRRLWMARLKPMKCQECGWAKRSPDGRLPLELDHMNGNRYDNRLDNLRILCPNCHSLQSTHRGMNKKKG